MATKEVIVGASVRGNESRSFCSVYEVGLGGVDGPVGCGKVDFSLEFPVSTAG